MAVPLRRDVKSPLAARNDAENPALDTDDKKDDDKKPEEKKPEENKPDDKKADEKKPDEKKATEDKKPEEKTDDRTLPPANVNIDIDGFEARAVVLPPKAGNYADLQAIKGKLLYRRAPRTGSGEREERRSCTSISTEREEKTVLDDADGLRDHRRRQEDAGREQEASTRSSTSRPRRSSRSRWSPPTWRRPSIRAPSGGRCSPTCSASSATSSTTPACTAWTGRRLRERYSKLLDDAVTRWDVDFVIGEFIGELNASHTYHGGGDMEQAPQRSVGLLGVDWELANGAYRIKRIVRGGPWDASVRSPLDEPGVMVKEGEYVLAVNGIPIDTKADPWASFQGLGDKTVVLTVNSSPAAAGARQVVVKCLPSENELRFRAWIEERRQLVDKATNGRIGYIYVQSTGVDAQNELVRQFMAQWKKEGLIIDERWNSGGQIPDRFVELLNRPILAYWAVRDGASQQWPPVAHRGPQVMLINGWSGSGGDAFPSYFREAGLGPLIGTRTWGGLIGISGAPRSPMAAAVTVPTFRMYDPKGQWFAEGHGVEPDIAVDDDPAQLAAGNDPQLARAIKEVTERAAKAPKAPARPPYRKEDPANERKPLNRETRIRSRAASLILSERVVWITVEPALPGFARRDHGM